MVISLHVSATPLSNAYCVMAVPSFFIISGYFTYSNDKQQSLSRIKHSLISLSKYFFLGVCINLAYDLIMCLSAHTNIFDCLRSYFIYGYTDIRDLIFFHKLHTPRNQILWFLLALIVAQALHYCLIKFDTQKIYKYLIPFILLVAWAWLTPVQRYLHDHTDWQYWDGAYIRNGFVLGLALVELGYFLKEAADNHQLWNISK